MFGRFTFVFAALAAIFFAQAAQAAKGPKITHKVYFDIKHGDKNLGRGMFHNYLYNQRIQHIFPLQSLWVFLEAYVYIPPY